MVLFRNPEKAEKEKGKTKKRLINYRKKETDLRKKYFARMGHLLLSSCHD